HSNRLGLGDVRVRLFLGEAPGFLLGKAPGLLLGDRYCYASDAFTVEARQKRLGFGQLFDQLTFWDGALVQDAEGSGDEWIYGHGFMAPSLGVAVLVWLGERI